MENTFNARKQDGLLKRMPACFLFQKLLGRAIQRVPMSQTLGGTDKCFSLSPQSSTCSAALSTSWNRAGRQTTGKVFVSESSSTQLHDGFSPGGCANDPQPRMTYVWGRLGRRILSTHRRGSRQAESVQLRFGRGEKSLEREIRGITCQFWLHVRSNATRCLEQIASWCLFDLRDPDTRLDATGEARWAISCLRGFILSLSGGSGKHCTITVFLLASPLFSFCMERFSEMIRLLPAHAASS